MSFSKWMKGAAFCMVAGGALSIVSAADTQNWKVESDANGQITEMTYPNPVTPLSIEKTLVFKVSTGGRPVGGSVNFTNGFERDMKPGEVNAYFDMFDGAKSAWDFLQSSDKLITIKSDGKIPADWLGRSARIVTKTGKNVIGRLVASSTDGEWIIEVDNACCGPIHFTMAGIEQVQELKAR
jgi:hypothetical protein